MRRHRRRVSPKIGLGPRFLGITRTVKIPSIGKDEYATLRGLMDDADALPESYEFWKQASDSNERYLKRQGFWPLPVVVDPEAFAVWCGAEGRPRDMKSFQDFIAASPLEALANR